MEITVVTHVDQAVPDSETETDSAYLSALAEQLGRAGLYARLNFPIGRPPTLHVCDPSQPELEEPVLMEQAADGVWWFCWPWGGRIAPAEAGTEATACIRRVVSAA